MLKEDHKSQSTNTNLSKHKDRCGVKLQLHILKFSQYWETSKNTFQTKKNPSTAVGLQLSFSATAYQAHCQHHPAHIMKHEKVGKK